MEFFCFLFITIAVIAVKAATKAAKTSGAARGLWVAKKRGILERLREQEGAVIQHTEDLRERAARFEPPPVPQDRLDEAEQALRNWGADPAVMVEELPEPEPAVELPQEPIVAPEPLVEPGPQVHLRPEPVQPPALVDLEPFIEVEEEFFDPLAGPAVAASGVGLGAAVGAAGAAAEGEPARPRSGQLGRA